MYWAYNGHVENLGQELVSPTPESDYRDSAVFERLSAVRISECATPQLKTATWRKTAELPTRVLSTAMTGLAWWASIVLLLLVTSDLFLHQAGQLIQLGFYAMMIGPILVIGLAMKALFNTIKDINNRARPEPGQIRVAISVSKDGVVFGRDTGLVTFSDGALFFEGSATTFSFSPTLIHAPLKAGPWEQILYRLNDYPPSTCGFEYEVEGNRFELNFVNTGTRPVYEPLKRWLASQTSMSINVLPPTIPGPFMVEEARRDFKSALSRSGFAFTFIAYGLASQFHHVGSSLKFWPVASLELLVGALGAIAVLVLGVAIPGYRAKQRIRILTQEIQDSV